MPSPCLRLSHLTERHIRPHAVLGRAQGICSAGGRHGKHTELGQSGKGTVSAIMRQA